jgi:hypothetical protein
MILDTIVRQFNISKGLALLIDVITNIDTTAVVMLGINNAGVYKYTLFGLYFVLIA